MTIPEAAAFAVASLTALIALLNLVLNWRKHRDRREDFYPPPRPRGRETLG